MIITTAPPAAPIVLSTPAMHLFQDSRQAGACLLSVPSATGLDMQLLNVTATGTVKPNQPGELEIGLFASVNTPNQGPPSADVSAQWWNIGTAAPEPIGGTTDPTVTSWMIQGVTLMFNFANGKLQGMFQSNVADTPVPPANLLINPLEIRADVSPIMYYAIGARFTPETDDGSTPELTLVHFTMTGEL